MAKGSFKGAGLLVRKVNLRHFRRHRLRSLLTVTGIAAGVALVFSISVINATLLGSFRASVRDLAGEAELEVAAADPTGFPLGRVRDVERVSGVDRAVPVLRESTRLSTSAGRERVLVLGITLAYPSLFPERFLPETDLDLANLGGIVLSENVASSLGVGLGDRVRVEGPSGAAPVSVAGIARGGALSALNAGEVAALPISEAQRIFERPDRANSIYVVVRPNADVGSIRSDIAGLFEGSAVVGAPGERGEGFERVYAGLGTLLSLAGTVALFVALFVVYNTMSMSIAERRRELSTSMSLGATRQQVFLAFMGEALVLGAVASALGIAGGWILARALVEQASEGFRVLPAAGSGPLIVNASHLVVAAVGGISVSLAGAFVPARRVLDVAPVEALRPEAAYEWSRSRTLDPHLIAVLGIAGIAVGGALFVAGAFVEDQRWLPTLGMVFGLGGVTFLLPLIVPRAIGLVHPFIARVFGAIGRLAADALRKNPGRTTFTVGALVLTLGVAIGVGSALASYEAQVERSASALIGAPIYVTADSFSGLTSDQPLPVELRARLERVKGTGYVYPLRFTFVNLGSEIGVLYAVPVAEALEHGATTDLEAGGFSEDPEELVEGLEEGGVAISRLTADRRSLDVGDEISLPTPDGKRSFAVAGIYDDLIGFDSLYIDYERYAEIWHDDKADEFGVLVEETANVDDVRAELEGLVDRRDIPARIQTEDELLAFIAETVEGTFSLGRGIQLAALIVAALTIANTLFTAVFERRWEMGLQRALGMSGSQLGRGVLLEAAVIGTVGGVGGAIVGTVAGFLMTRSMEAQFSWNVPFELPFALAGLAVLGGIAISAAAGVVPSRIAVRAPIIESLRYE